MLQRRPKLVKVIVLLIGLLPLLQWTTTNVSHAEELVTLQSVNVTGQFLRHRFFLGELSSITTTSDRADATFVKRRALSETAGAISFESVNLPGYFLRHSNFRLRLMRNDGTDKFRADASFHERGGLTIAPARSYESVNFPGRFIRHRNFHLWVEVNNNSSGFREDATFLVRPGLAVSSFSSKNFSDRFIRHQLHVGKLTPLANDLDRADASFVVRPGLNGATGAVSFESVNLPGQFLRHSFFRVRLARDDGTAAFKADASFRERAGLAAGGISYESTNFPGRFIRHRNFELWVDSNNGGAAFAQDATFSKLRGMFSGLAIDEEDMLRRHNVSRNLHCAAPVSWSSALEAAAQAWANKCTRNGTGFAHDPNRGPVGENLAWGTDLSATRAAGLWYEEEPLYNYASPGFTPATGHFTQMVWRNTSQIGCAKAVCGAQNLWVCRYAPAGNVSGQFPQNVQPKTCQ